MCNVSQTHSGAGRGVIARGPSAAQSAVVTANPLAHLEAPLPVNSSAEKSKNAELPAKEQIIAQLQQGCEFERDPRYISENKSNTYRKDKQAEVLKRLYLLFTGTEPTDKQLSPQAKGALIQDIKARLNKAQIPTDERPAFLR